MKKRNRIAIGYAAATALASVAAPAVHATVIAYDDFSGDTVGATLGTDTNDGTGWAGDWQTTPNFSTYTGTVVTAPANFNVPSGLTASQAASFNADTSGANILAFRQLDAAAAAVTSSISGATPSNPVSIYFSFVIQRLDTNAHTLNVALYGSQYQASGGNPQVNTNDLFDVALNGGGPDWAVNFYTSVTTSSSQGNGTSLTYSSTQSGANENTQQLVLELDYRGNGNNDDSLELYYDPTSTSATPIISETGLNLNYTFPVDAIRVFAGGGSPTTGFDISDIALATSLADVVPEPATLALFCLPAVALLTRRRSRTSGA